MAEFGWYRPDLDRQRKQTRRTLGDFAKTCVTGYMKFVVAMIVFIVFIACALTVYRFIVTFGQPECEIDVYHSRVPEVDPETGEIIGVTVEENLYRSPACDR